MAHRYLIPSIILLIAQTCICLDLPLKNAKPLPEVNVPITLAGNESLPRVGIPGLAYECGIHEPLEHIDPRDFYVNTINLLKQLALKTPSETALEAPRVINGADAESVVVSIGGGDNGKGRITRKVMTTIMFNMMSKIIENGFAKQTCAFIATADPGTILGVWRVEPSESYHARTLNGTASDVKLSKRVLPRASAPPANETSLGVVPVLESVYNERVKLDLPGFYIAIAVGIYGLTPVDKTTEIDEIALELPGLKVVGKIRGARPPQSWRTMTAREVIDVLDELMRETLRRIDDEGKTYNAVTSKIFDPHPQLRNIRVGVVTLQARPGAVSSNETEIFS